MIKYLAVTAVAFLTATAAGNAADRPITYDCDTAPGHFSELVLPAPAGAFTVSGNLSARAIAKDKQWAPTAKLLISPPPKSPGLGTDDYAGVTLTALPGKSVNVKMDVVQYLSFTTKGRDGEIIAGTFSAPGTAQPFGLSYDGRSVVVTVGSERRTYLLATTEPVVRIVCSTGEFLFTDIQVKPR